VVNGPAKLVIWDMNNNCTIQEYVFTNDVLPFNNSFLNDIVVDETNGFAYMSDTFANGGIIIYDFNGNRARRWDDPTLQANTTAEIKINGISYPFDGPSDGIALSHDTETVYYCDISGTHIYSVPAIYLRNFTLPDAEISQYVIDYGEKGYSDGMAFASNGLLYFGNQELTAVSAWNVSTPLDTATVIFQNSTTVQWVDTFAFDQMGHLIFTTNRLQLYLFGGMDWTGGQGPNFRIFSTYIDADSYLTGDPIPTHLPCLVGDQGNLPS